MLTGRRSLNLWKLVDEDKDSWLSGVSVPGTGNITQKYCRWAGLSSSLLYSDNQLWVESSCSHSLSTVKCLILHFYMMKYAEQSQTLCQQFTLNLYFNNRWYTLIMSVCFNSNHNWYSTKDIYETKASIKLLITSHKVQLAPLLLDIPLS